MITATTAVLLTIAMAAVPTATAETVAAGVATQEVGDCVQTGEASFTLDRQDDIGVFQTDGACGHVHGAIPATACETTQNDRIWCDHDFDSGANLNLTLGPDGDFQATYDSGSLWIVSGNLERVDI